MRALQVVIEVVGLPPTLSPNTALDPQLGLESLDFAELVMRLKQPTGKDSFGTSATPQIRTMADLAAAVERTAPTSDALFLGFRPGVQYENLGHMTFRRKLEGPQCFVLASNATDTIPRHVIDIVPGDGDSAN